MAMLFNVTLENIDFNTLKNSLIQSSLETYDEEQALVEALYSLQLRQVDMINLSEAYVEDIIANSTENIYVNARKVVSSGVPTIKAATIDVGVVGLDNSSGLMHSEIIESKYSEFYWRMGDYVEINNNSIVPRTLVTTLDAILTRDILEGFFLKTTPGEILSRCTTSYVAGGTIASPTINDKKAINYGDLKRFFFLKTDFIDVSIKEVKASGFIIGQNYIYGKNISLPSNVVAKKLISDLGTVNLRNFNSEYLLAGGYILNNSTLDIDAETNTVLLATAVSILNTEYAPKIDWISTDLKKADRKSDAFMDGMIQDVLANIAPSESRDYNSPVSMGELNYSISKIMEEISNLGVCDDN